MCSQAFAIVVALGHSLFQAVFEALTRLSRRAFCKRIVTDYKVAAIPVSAFYEENPVTSVVRFCFSKNDATLDTALERLSDAVHRR